MELIWSVPSCRFVRLTQRKASAWKSAILVSLALIIRIGVKINMIGDHSEPAPFNLFMDRWGLSCSYLLNYQLPN